MLGLVTHMHNMLWVICIILFTLTIVGMQMVITVDQYGCTTENNKDMSPCIMIERRRKKRTLIKFLFSEIQIRQF
jgi:hypothetical protein